MYNNTDTTDCQSIDINVNIDIKLSLEFAKAYEQKQQEIAKEEVENRIDEQVKEMWEVKKYLNTLLIHIYKKIPNTEEIVYRLINCARWLEYGITVAGKSKLIKVSSCHVRLCPICQYKRTLAIYRNICKIYDAIQRDYDYKHIFVTLTIRNVAASDMQYAVDNMLKAWSKLVKHRDMQRIIIGYTRTLEVTYNDNDNTYHPHIHALLTVPKNYGTTQCDYVTIDDMRAKWQQVLGVDYLPVVHIKKIKMTNHKPILEIAKYTIKPAEYDDILSDDDNIAVQFVQTLDTALHGKRLISYGGIINQMQRKLKIKKIENLEETTVEPENYDEKIIYQWHFGEYKYKRV